MNEGMETPEEIKDMPLWAGVILKTHAVLLLVSGAALILKVIFLMFESYRWYIEHYVTLGLFSLLIFLLVFYAIAVFRRKKWITPVIYAVAFSSSTIFLWVILFGKVHDWIGALCAVTVSLLIFSTAYVVTVFRSTLKGSMRNLKIQIPLLFVLSFLLIPVFVFPFLSLIYTDIDPIDDSDLILPYIPLLAEEDNAHYALIDFDTLTEKEQESVDQAVSLQRLLRDGEEIDLQEAIQLVEETRFITDAFIEASEKKGYQCPTSINSYTWDTVLCPLNAMREMAVLMSLRIHVEAALGLTEDALKHGTHIIQFASTMNRGEMGTLIEHLVAIAVSKIGLTSLEVTINKAESFSSRELLAVSDILANTKLGRRGPIRSYKGEYMITKYSVLQGDEYILYTWNPESVLSSYVWQPQRTLSRYAEMSRMRVAYGKMECGTGEQLASEMHNIVLETKKESISSMGILKRNIIGKTLLSVSLASLNTVKDKTCEADAQNQALQEKLQTLAAEAKLREEAELESDKEEDDVVLE
ncbi:MAG: hypothetical protein ACI92I_000658 [Acidimicrobiales bacterium]|jgi:hypothetical protein